MKIYALYYKDTFVVAFPNRSDCISYGQKYYEGYEWDCNILAKYLINYPTFIHSNSNQELVQPYNVQDKPMSLG